jgi:adenosylcobyric acid synthase
MLGRRITDSEGVEGLAGSIIGLVLRDVEMVLSSTKITAPAHARHLATGQRVDGDENQQGRTHGPACARPALDILDPAGGPDQPDGAISTDGRVVGAYVHGLFCVGGFRAAWLAGFGQASGLSYGANQNTGATTPSEKFSAVAPTAAWAKPAWSRLSGSRPTIIDMACRAAFTPPAANASRTWET